jgi:tetratricopeptide (TPR) repeat protein
LIHNAAVNTEHEAARLYNLGVENRRAGKLVASIEAYRRAQRLTPEDPDLLNNLAVVLHQDGRPMEALPLLQFAVKLEPTLVAAHINLGNAMRSVGKRAGAVRAYRCAIDLDAAAAAAHYNLFAALHDDEPIVAEQALERALALRPDHEMTRFQLAATRAWRLGQSENAMTTRDFLRIPLPDSL